MLKRREPIKGPRRVPPPRRRKSDDVIIIGASVPQAGEKPAGIPIPRNEDRKTRDRRMRAKNAPSLSPNHFNTISIVVPSLVKDRRVKLWNPCRLPRTPRSTGSAIKYHKHVGRQIGGSSNGPIDFLVPFVDLFGNVSDFVYAKWVTTVDTFCLTMIRTIFERIARFAVRHTNRRDCRGRLRSLMKAAALTFLVKPSLVTRLFGILRSPLQARDKFKVMNRLTYSTFQQTDEPVKVYLCWLLEGSQHYPFISERDKSVHKFRVPPDLFSDEKIKRVLQIRSVRSEIRTKYGSRIGPPFHNWISDAPSQV